MLNNNLTCNKVDGDPNTVTTNLGFNTGKHYWEITLDQFEELENVLIGVCRLPIDLYKRAQDTGQFWGYIVAEGKKFSGTPPQQTEYGGMSKIGDVIGILL